MKKILTSFYALFILFLVSSCSKNDRDINMNISEVTTFYAPNDNIFVKLEPATAASVGFEWEQAKAEDGSLVMYEIAFDEEGGDFSEPVYKVSSDGNGVQNRLTLSHKDLNRIANFAGIGSLETGKLLWTVLASKGTNVKQSALTRTLQVERPAGFAELPTELYITGDATEAGTDIASAIKMKQTSPGVFEIYTRLDAGTYHFVNRVDGNATSYQVEGTFIKEGGAVASPVTTPVVYRIEMDFNNAAVKLTEVVRVGYWFAPNNTLAAELDYEGNSVYRATDVPIEFKQEGWGRDERYKFRMTLKNEDGTEFTEDWGSSNRDNSRPDANTPAAWYNVFKYESNQWDYTFKFPEAADMKTVDLVLSFDPEATYRHEVVIK